MQGQSLLIPVRILRAARLQTAFVSSCSCNHHCSLTGHEVILLPGSEQPENSEAENHSHFSPSSCVGGSWSGPSGGPALIVAGSLRQLSVSWVALSWAQWRWAAPRGQLCPRTSHPTPGTSRVARASSSHGNNTDAGEQVPSQRQVFKPLLVSHPLKSHWPKRVP